MDSSGSEQQPALSPAEWQVMKVLWDGGPAAARDVIARLPKEAAWSPKTVKTLLSRLVAKGAVDYEQIGNSYLYRAAAPRDQMTRREIRGVVSRVVSEAVSPVLAHFIEETDLSEEEIKRLKQLLDEKRAGRGPKKSRGRR
ncbi:MAG TPA: BlaI/MecI/CopY family transcriptional regulator [Lacipirellula sp.]